MSKDEVVNCCDKVSEVKEKDILADAGIKNRKFKVMPVIDKLKKSRVI